MERTPPPPTSRATAMIKSAKQYSMPLPSLWAPRQKETIFPVSLPDRHRHKNGQPQGERPRKKPDEKGEAAEEFGSASRTCQWGWEWHISPSSWRASLKPRPPYQ